VRRAYFSLDEEREVIKGNEKNEKSFIIVERKNELG